MSDATSLPVRHLFTMEGSIGAIPPAVISGPSGTRVAVGVTNGTFKGDRLKGVVAPTVGGDFAVFRRDGSLRLDVRLVLNANDGTTIYMTYNGVGVPDENGVLQLKTAPTFEVGDGPLAWLNNVQAISIGHSDGAGLHYEVYEIV